MRTKSPWHPCVPSPAACHGRLRIGELGGDRYGEVQGVRRALAQVHNRLSGCCITLFPRSLANRLTEWFHACDVWPVRQ